MKLPHKVTFLHRWNKSGELKESSAHPQLISREIYIDGFHYGRQAQKKAHANESVVLEPDPQHGAAIVLDAFQAHRVLVDMDFVNESLDPETSKAEDILTGLLKRGPDHVKVKSIGRYVTTYVRKDWVGVGHGEGMSQNALLVISYRFADGLERSMPKGFYEAFSSKGLSLHSWSASVWYVMDERDA